MSGELSVNKLLWMQCFVRVVETGSFSAVAREMKIGQPNVSRHIASLEDWLNIRLIHRSTRQLSVTLDGKKYFEQARYALNIISEADSIAQSQSSPHGLLRVACAPCLGTEKIIPALSEFYNNFPEIEFDFQLSDDYIDLTARGIDVAIRGGFLKDSGFRAKQVGLSDRIFGASAKYLDRYGEPTLPKDLSLHKCLGYTAIAGGKGNWPFTTGDVAVAGQFQANSLDGVRSAVMSDLGIGYLPSWMISQQLRDQTLKKVLTDFTHGPSPVNAIYAAGQVLPERAKIFIEFLVEVFSQTPGLDGRAVNEGKFCE
jgi:DNA-binding transcriptional LysR family regulator